MHDLASVKNLLTAVVLCIDRVDPQLFADPDVQNPATLLRCSTYLQREPVMYTGILNRLLLG